MGSGRRRRGRPCSSSNERRRRNRYLWPSFAFRELPLLLGAVVFAGTALKGGVLASSNPLELNGGSCLAMAGKGCVALAVDRRFGLEGQLVSAEAKRVLKVPAPACSKPCTPETTSVRFFIRRESHTKSCCVCVYVGM